MSTQNTSLPEFFNHIQSKEEPDINKNDLTLPVEIILGTIEDVLTEISNYNIISERIEYMIFLIQIDIEDIRRGQKLGA